MSQVLKLIRVNRTCTYINRIIESTESIQERHLKHIAEISKHLATEPIQSEELTYEQQEWMRRKMRSGFIKPIRDQLTALEKGKRRTPK